ncbi:MAG: coxB [Thermoleophilia bacterium]|nr:coxB [Thermoleophilia bacterium]
MKGQWGRLAGYFIGTLLISSAVTFGLPLLGGGSWLPDLVSSEGKAIDQLFWGLLILSLIIFAIVAAIVIYSMVHFRAAPGDLSDGEHIHGNAKMEAAWVIIPSLIVFVIGLLSYNVLRDNEVGLYDQEAAAHDAPGAAQMQVEVRGFQFGWAFRYLDRDGKQVVGEKGDEPQGELVVPVDKVIKFNVMSCSGKERLGRLRRQVDRKLDAGDEEDEFAKIEPGLCERKWDLTTEDDRASAEDDQAKIHAAQAKQADGKHLSADERKLLDAQPRFKGDDQFVDVNHAFWVPEARLKIDAVSGLRTYVQWQATHVTGPQDHYQVVCAELCGSGHNGMRTDMCVVSKNTWDWFKGLGQDERKTATCVNLRLLACLDKIDDRSAALEDIVALSKKHPNAGCDQAEEAVA